MNVSPDDVPIVVCVGSGGGIGEGSVSKPEAVFVEHKLCCCSSSKTVATTTKEEVPCVDAVVGADFMS